MRTIHVALACCLFSLAPSLGRADNSAALPVVDVKGLKAELGKLKGKPVVVNFWATWCRPCMVELPMLGKLQSEYGPRGIAFYGVSLDTLSFDEAESKKRIPPALAKANVTYAQAILKATPDEIIDGFNLQGGAIPATLFLGADGAEVDRIEGMLDEKSAKEKIDKLVSKAKPKP